MCRSPRLAFMVGTLVLLSGCGRQGSLQPAVQSEDSDRVATRPFVSESDGTNAVAEPSATAHFEMSAESPASSSRSDEAVARSGLAAAGDSSYRAAEKGRGPADAEFREYRSREEMRTPAAPAYQVQSGLLTAGSIDDHERFEAYRQFLSQSLQNDAAETLPRLAIGRRVMIQVVNTAGLPVGDARVVVQEPSGWQNRRSAIDLTTGSDGRAMFLTGIDGGADGQEFLVSVHGSSGEKPYSKRVRLDGQPWHIVLPNAPALRPTRLDLALVIDTTGSMGDELEYLKAEIDEIAATVKNMFPNVDQRFALIVYRDEGDQYVTRSYDFTESLSEFRSMLATQRAAGGGDYPEAVHVALEQAGQLSWRDRETSRMLFLVADAPPHDRFANRSLDAVQNLRRQGVRVFPVASSGTRLKAEFVLRAASFLTMGQYLFLTDHSGVGNPHAKPHAPEYTVEHLNRLMVRMIAQQLAGRRLVPQEVIAIERGDLSPLDFRVEPPCHQQQETQVSLTLPRISIQSLSTRFPLRLAALALIIGGAFAADLVRGRFVR
ncbi:MAG: VWA domain-containing protein [Planctomycetes bacterium]|nr:VWA domain-containing protein [Planctomycetota bacterium]MBL7040445.1 VWA domain-containing protein [Pirellulaceae bacterium]